MLDLLVAGQALDAADLLDLQGERVAVLEHDRDHVADQDPARALHRDHAMAIVVADRAVQGGPLDVSPGDGTDQAHDACVPQGHLLA